MQEFAQDIYDVLGMNTNFQTQKGFFDKYVEDDDAFMINQFEDKAVIYFDDFEIIIKPNR